MTEQELIKKSDDKLTLIYGEAYDTGSFKDQLKEILVWKNQLENIFFIWMLI